MYSTSNLQNASHGVKLCSVPEGKEAFMKFERSSCPITNVLDLLGDKWTLLVIRDLVLGKRRYQEFLESPEEIASNILADRLNKLLVAGLITRHAYQRNPTRYEYFLTKKGKGLEPILEAIIVWGKKQFPGTKRFPRIKQFPGLMVQVRGRRTKEGTAAGYQAHDVRQQPSI
jgi:DNA-binding HxlR family transcriptional regulator